MKFIKICFASGALYVAMATHAHADPVSLIATAIHGFLLSSTAIAATSAGLIATVAANVIVGGALLGLSMLGRQRQTGAVNPSDAKGTFEGGQSSVIEGLGRVRVGGMKAFGNTNGSTRWRVVCRLQGPIDAVEEYFVGGRAVTVEANGDVSSPPWARPGGSWMLIFDKLGNGSETAWGTLTAAFPSLWTADHRMRGIAQSLITYLNPGLSEPKYLTLYQSGVPDTEWLARASKVYDPFDELSDPDDPATWVWSENGILNAVHVLRRDPAFTSDRFDWSLITAQAVKANQSVATKTGTEKRARCWGMWAWEGARKDTMEDILRSIGAEIRLTAEGKIWFELIDDDPEPEIAFTPADFVDFDWVSGPEAVERPNICRVKYYSPERNFEMADIDMTGIAWARVEEEVTRYGPKYFDVDLPFCPSASQAQRIARRLFALARGDTGVAVTNMAGLGAWGRYYGTVELPDLGDVEKVRFAPPRVDDARGTVEVPFAIWPSLPAWNPAIDEAAAPDVVPDLAYEGGLPQPSAPIVALQITYPAGAKELRVGYVLPSVTYNAIEAAYRLYSGGLPGPWASMTEYSTFAHVAADVLGAQIDTRVRIFNDDEGSPFSPLLNTVVGIDNTACGPPVVTGGVESDPPTLSATAAAMELRAASIRLDRRTVVGGVPSAWVTIDQKNALPGQELSFSDAGTVGAEWRLLTVTSNGTEGAPVLLS